MGTIRQHITDLLEKHPMNARDLSQALSMREKEVYEHLPHIARSASARGKKLIIRPFRCLECGYRFEERRRFTRPGRCPRCRKTHLERPSYHIC